MTPKVLLRSGSLLSCKIFNEILFLKKKCSSSFYFLRRRSFVFVAEVFFLLVERNGVEALIGKLNVRSGRELIENCAEKSRFGSWLPVGTSHCIASAVDADVDVVDVEQQVDGEREREKRGEYSVLMRAQAEARQ